MLIQQHTIRQTHNILSKHFRLTTYHIYTSYTPSPTLRRLAFNSRFSRCLNSKSFVVTLKLQHIECVSHSYTPAPAECFKNSHKVHITYMNKYVHFFLGALQMVWQSFSMVRSSHTRASISSTVCWIKDVTLICVGFVLNGFRVTGMAEVGLFGHFSGSRFIWTFQLSAFF